MSIFDVALERFIDMNHELVLLSKQIVWEVVESDFVEYYCADNGRPAVQIRTRDGEDDVVEEHLQPERRTSGCPLAGESLPAVLHW